MSTAEYESRLTGLRAQMVRHQLDACVILSADPHLSEYLPEHWQVRQWLSGFAGSAGSLVVTRDMAGLWVDSRYWEQAAIDLAGGPIDVFRLGAPDVPDPVQWVAANMASGQRVWLDERTLAVREHERWRAALLDGQQALVGEPDLLAAIWTDRPALPASPIYLHRPPFACRSRAENLAAIRGAMRARGAQWHCVSALDEVAWLLNLRGADVPYNPVFLAHMLIGLDDASVFVDARRLPADLRRGLEEDGIRVQAYEDVADSLCGLPAADTMLFDDARLTTALWKCFGHMRQVRGLNPAQEFKSRKNQEEIANIRRTMDHDGAALCEFFAWFEQAVGRGTVTELTVDEQITAARSRQPDFVSPSFATIAAWNANGAMPHYQATDARHAVIEGDGLLLIDSGGQYLGGTTDITRVVAVGTTTPEQRRDFTIVLKGMIALSRAHFPVGIPGPMIDALARAPIWRMDADFGHGTGHGVGYFMNVHEGPQSISPRWRTEPSAAMCPGMVTSNEPGLYRPGKWGIRIENLVLTVPSATNEFGEFQKFETLTMCPIDTRCIDTTLLSPCDIQWLNAYHAEVRRRLEPLVQGAAREWLIRSTQPLV